MREIKFRVWDKEADNPQGKGLKGVMLCHEWLMRRLNTSFIYFLEKGKLMQYIGLKDKNGKEIYEGDIVKAIGTRINKKHDFSSARNYVSPNIKDINETITEESIFQCYWNETFSQWDFKSKTHSIWVDISDRNYEIIGNIHENPELL